MKTSFSYLALAFGLLAYAEERCKCFPGDACWPSDETWHSFNQTVRGRLIKTEPMGRVCHDPNYDEAACEALRAVWKDAQPHLQTSYSPMQPWFANQSCDPFTSQRQQCTVGTYIPYAVNVSTAEDVASTLSFVKEHNIRLVIRNTGHDYIGKSTGPGAVALWVRHLNSIEMVDWKDSHYQGKALRVGTGVLVADAIKFAAENNRTVVSGTSGTLALAGGYIQGGGHGPLASKYGMAADQALEYEVVDASGKRLIASRRENTDLFWALSGGGPGTWGVVLSAVVKTVPNVAVAFKSLEFSAANISQETYMKSTELLIPFVLDLTDRSCTAYYYILPFGVQSTFVCPDTSAAEMATIMKPLLDQLDELGIIHDKSVTPFARYSDYHATVWDFFNKGQTGIIKGSSWLIPRSVLRKTPIEVVVKALYQALDHSFLVSMLSFNPSAEVAGDVDNSVHPTWRDFGLFVLACGLWNEADDMRANTAVAQQVLKEAMPLLRNLAPEGGAYMSEADPADPDWKMSFYASNYDRLLEIKNRYDPEGVFYAYTGIGSDRWNLRPDGRLCEAQQAEESIEKEEL